MSLEKNYPVVKGTYLEFNISIYHSEGFLSDSTPVKITHKKDKIDPVTILIGSLRSFDGNRSRVMEDYLRPLITEATRKGFKVNNLDGLCKKIAYLYSHR